MKKAILMGAALMLCTAMALAQDTPSSGASSQSGASPSSSHRQQRQLHADGRQWSDVSADWG